MPIELLTVGKYVLAFIACQIAIFWLLTPFAIWEVKKRLEKLQDAQDRLHDDVRTIAEFANRLAQQRTVAAPTATTAPVIAPRAVRPQTEVAPVAAMPAEAAQPEPAPALAPVAEPVLEAAPAPLPEPAAEPEAAFDPFVPETEPAPEPAVVALPTRAAAVLATKKPKLVKSAADAEDLDLSDSEDIEDEALEAEDDPSYKLASMNMRRRREVLEEEGTDPIIEGDDGLYRYRGKKYAQLIDAMRQQQIDASIRR